MPWSDHSTIEYEHDGWSILYPETEIAWLAFPETEIISVQVSKEKSEIKSERSHQSSASVIIVNSQRKFNVIEHMDS